MLVFLLIFSSIKIIEERKKASIENRIADGFFVKKTLKRIPAVIEKTAEMIISFRRNFRKVNMDIIINDNIIIPKGVEILL